MNEAVVRGSDEGGVMNARENWDWVSFENYSADMAELSSMAANVVRSKQDEIKSLHRTIWLLVKASGGRVQIPLYMIDDYQAETAVLTIEETMDDRSRVVTAR